MKVDANEEERGAVSVHVTNESAEVYVPADVGHGGKGCCDVRGVVYCKEQACYDLSNKAKAQE